MKSSRLFDFSGRAIAKLLLYKAVPFAALLTVLPLLHIGVFLPKTASNAYAQTENPKVVPAGEPTELISSPNISFRRPLRVTGVRISNNRELRRSNYLFQINFPEDAVEPLEKLVFEQIEGAQYPRFSPRRSYAFDANNDAELPFSRLENDADNRRITVEFDPPVNPGQQLTVALNARNPRSGSYIYRLTAFPVGATEGQYAGVERLDFHESFRRRRFNRW